MIASEYGHIHILLIYVSHLILMSLCLRKRENKGERENEKETEIGDFYRYLLQIALNRLFKI